MLTNFIFSQSIATEEYEVMSAVLSKYDKENNEFVIKEETIQYNFDINDKDGNFAFLSEVVMPNLLEETKKDFNSKNDKTYTLEKKFTFKSNYKFISEADKQNIFKDDFPDESWKTFYKKYPKALGLYHFSRVGFNNDKNQALIVSYESRGSLWMEGKLFFLVKKKNGWYVEKDYIFIVS